MAETEYTTVLFTDVVGSTELHSNMSPEAGDELRRNHFRALRQAIASSGGKEVKNLGDGLMVVFPAASRALDCAIAMQQSVHRGNSNLNRSLELRVGISAGEAAIEDGDYFGDPVVEAARLCARARGGQILVADLVRASAGRRSSHSFSVIGRVYLKGLTDPVDTLELAWEPLDEDVPRSDEVPFPAPLAHRPRVGVIGRETELAALHAAAKRVASGEGREVLLLAGEPGQGKTTLVSEAARRCHEAGMTVLFGRCDEEVSAPYRPFHEALNHYVKYADERSLRSHVAALGGELARLAPALQHRLGSSPPALTNDGETERYLLYAAVTALLESAGAVHGVVLVLDDLHWADKPSLQLLRHVVANSSGFRLLILGTYRDSELSSAHPLNDVLAAFHREPYGFSIIGLKGLNDADVIAYMEAAAGHHLDDDAIGLAQDLYRETDGNPFFVGEVLRHLYESGVIVQDASGRWFATEAPGRQALPHSIRAVIGTRVSRLGERAMLVLSAASVIGRDFDIDLLTEAISVEDEGEELIDLLDKAQRAALVHEIP
ncbi:MAG TPA: AAA family ATPase, partial [Acidimicrobiales bacterium]|nr:AAA family ATPase [Acidimicrobiales bacterium]